MPHRIRAAAMLAAACALSGCMSEDVLRYDGVTTQAGDAIAANSALQMVDPWPRGVEETHLRTPYRVPAPAPAEDSAAGGQTSDY